MPIEPGFVAPVKVALANATAITAVVWFAWQSVTSSSGFVANMGRTAAALFFSLFMQSLHSPVGPSELHFIGTGTIYLTLGFLPIALGFAFGLLLQGLLFEPTDLVHLGVNTLLLLFPLLVVHPLRGKNLFNPQSRVSVGWPTILKLDAMYYAGITLMVGFWLVIGEVETPFSAWLVFASSYLVLVACGPVITWTLLKGLRKLHDNSKLSRCFITHPLILVR